MQNLRTGPLQTMPLRAAVTAQLAARSAAERISHTGRRFVSEERGEMAAWIILTFGLVAMAAYALKVLNPWFTGKVDAIQKN